MKIVRRAWCALVLATLVTPALAGAAPVRTESGLVSGTRAADPAVTVYRGIPYATAPVGPLRWRPPAAPAKWKGVRAATAFGPTCPQPRGPGTPAGRMSEDCLTLNVWTAAAKPAERRPVLVWIYGGGFVEGSGANPQFDGTALAKKGVIVVTFNYRLGVLGFLSTPELSRESGRKASGNYGLLDDIAVLKWVQRNIAAFGGDRSRVTIAGQSAGAGSVGFLSMSPLAQGLFQRSIAESHARDPRDTELRYLSVSYRRLADAERSGTDYARARGGSTLAALRAMPWERLVEGSNTIDDAVETGSTAKPPLFRPVLDGWVVPQTYDATMNLGAQNPITFVAGNNKDETGAVPETAFAGLRARTEPARGGMPPVNVTLAAYRAWAARRFGPLADDFLNLYPASNDQEAALQSNAAAHDNSRVSTYLWGIQWTRRATKPVYTYFWTHAPPGPSHDTRGAYHGSEISYVFGNLYPASLPWTDEDRHIANIVSSYWVNIIATGDPNGAGLPAWPRFDANVPQVMEIGDHFGPIPVASPERIVFWKRFFASQTPW